MVSWGKLANWPRIPESVWFQPLGESSRDHWTRTSTLISSQVTFTKKPWGIIRWQPGKAGLLGGLGDALRLWIMEFEECLMNFGKASLMIFLAKWYAYLFFLRFWWFFFVWEWDGQLLWIRDPGQPSWHIFRKLILYEKYDPSYPVFFVWNDSLATGLGLKVTYNFFSMFQLQDVLSGTVQCVSPFCFDLL